MDNKLSELSKPVAQIYYDEHDSSVMRIGWFRSDEPKNPEPLYSQEYVSALLAELKAKDKRIAELESGHQEAAKQIASWRRIAKQNIEEREKDLAALDAERQKIIGMEAKLATPVRLPDIRFINVGETAVAVMHATSVKEQIQRAGFTVEGDEQ
ncbi:hypothetical protein [Serratia sp. Nf2]|uniref:hypothetical protein n=1 Tax=Serratia sp. Nf2 TaxID=2116540 RepID=UPI0018EA3576|nr:hypothetical protein [Serratia sp. Nf2]